MEKLNLNQLNEERRWLWACYVLNSKQRQMKPQKLDLKDIKEGDQASRKPPVLTMYI